MDRIILHKDSYFDSVFLMSISAEISRMPGISLGQILLATKTNRELLERQNFSLKDHGDLGATDLIVALRADAPAGLDAAQSRLAELLKGRPRTANGSPGLRTVGLGGALRDRPEANLALISVPGAYAAYEAWKALAAGLHVMLFSDNVSLEDEIALKRYACSRGLLLMGPDCGTAILNGRMLGFANRVRRGPVGIVGASGTGIQEVSCLLERFGGGISQAIGTGGRDLSKAVGAQTTLLALTGLATDPDTQVLVVLSKPPCPEIADRVIAHLKSLGKPAVVHFVGASPRPACEKIHFASDLDSCAAMAFALTQGWPVADVSPIVIAKSDVQKERLGKKPSQRFIHGLFTGGTLGAEALHYMKARFEQVRSNLNHGSAWEDGVRVQGHCVIDLGDDIFTCGRPHPMIDPSPRVERLRSLADDESVAVVLVDVVLGTGSHEDPAGVMVPAIEHVRDTARSGGRSVSFVASVTGTEQDSQRYNAQVRKLSAAGVTVMTSNIQAARMACCIVEEA